MGLRLGATVLNVADIEAMTDFWCATLGLSPNHRDEGDEFRVLRGGATNVSLQVAGTPVTARDQMHLDLYTADPDAEAARLEGLGAEQVRRVDDPEDTYVVMRDPEGNEFCLCLVRDA